MVMSRSRSTQLKTSQGHPASSGLSISWRASLKDREIAMQGNGKAAATIVIVPLKSALTTGFDLPEERKPEMIALIPLMIARI